MLTRRTFLTTVAAGLAAAFGVLRLLFAALRIRL